jgi:hypothetical protein
MDELEGDAWKRNGVHRRVELQRKAEWTSVDAVLQWRA